MSPIPLTPRSTAARTAAEPPGGPVCAPVTVPDDAGPGWLRALMNAAAMSAALRLARGPVLAVAASRNQLCQPAAAGQRLRCRVEDVRYGRTSLTLALAVWTEGPGSRGPVRLTAADYTFVAVDGDGRSRPVPESPAAAAAHGVGPAAEACHDPAADRDAGDPPWMPPT